MEIKLEQKLKNYFANRKTTKYKKGELILKPGKVPNYVGFIKSGYVRVYSVAENGQEITRQFFKPIFYFTLMCAASGLKNRYFFEALTPVEIYQSPVSEMIGYISKNPVVFKAVIKNILTAFFDTIDQLGYLLSGSAYNKVAGTIVSLSNRSKPGGTYSQIDFGITHKLIASLTGLTRETVTLQMIKLEKEGLIKNSHRKVIVVNKNGLTRASKITEKG